MRPKHYTIRDRLAPVLAKILAPELAEDGGGLSVVFTSESAVKMHASAGAMYSGCTWAIPGIQRGNRPAAPGLVIPINDDDFEQAGIANRVWLTQLIAGIVAHEAGHALTNKRLFARKVSRKMAAEVAATIRQDVYKWPAQGSSIWTDHDCNWIRATAHLTYRLKQHGFETHPRYVADAGLYGLPDGLTPYFLMLWSEAKAAAPGPLRKFLKRNPIPVHALGYWVREIGAVPQKPVHAFTSSPSGTAVDFQ